MNDVDDDDLINRHRWVRIMCDYSCDGVWDIEGRACGAEDLPISPSLIARIRRWQAHYEAIEDAVDAEGRSYRECDWTAFSQEGLAIARAVKAALPDWTVIYFDEARAAIGGAPSGYEYEIRLDGEKDEPA